MPACLILLPFLSKVATTQQLFNLSATFNVGYRFIIRHNQVFMSDRKRKPVFRDHKPGKVEEE